jgi:hypothetical protein
VDKFWISAVKATGPVAVVGFILWYFLQRLYSTEIIELFSSQQRFVVTLSVVGALVIVLWASVRGHYLKRAEANSPAGRTANISNTKIGGDFVMGDKVGRSDSDQ